jgi:hypothetical protein
VHPGPGHRQLERPSDADPLPTLPHLTLDELEVLRSRNQVDCTVRLRAASVLTTGTASEPDTPSGQARAAARATLRAAEGLGPFRFGLEGVRTVDLFGEPSVFLLVDARAGRHHARLPGIALLDQSIEEATAVATLHALQAWSG